MAITEEHEKQAASFRGKHRQNKAQPWLIRTTDGSIFPNVPLIAKRQNMRPYSGDINAPVEERMKMLAGMPGRRTVVFDEVEPFNITKASKTELIAFAMDEYSEVIGEDEHINKVRAIVCKLAELDYNEVFGGGRAGVGLQQPAAAGA